MAPEIILKSKYAVEKKSKVFFTGHQLQITDDAQFIFCQCSHAVNIVEICTGDTISTIDSEDDDITCISLAPNNHSLAIGYQSSSLKHYNVENILNPRLLTSFRSYHHGPVTSLGWDLSSSLLATGSSDGSARVWDLKQKFCTHSLKGAQGVFKILMFDTDFMKRAWVFGAADDRIYIWHLMSGNSKLIGALDDHSSTITGLQLTHDRTKLISCGLDKVLILWDLEKLTSIKIVPVFEPLSGIILQPKESDFYGLIDDKYCDCVLAIGNKGILSIWDVATSKECWRSDKPSLRIAQQDVLLVNQILHIPSKESILLATYDHTILLQNLRTKHIWKHLSGYNDDIIDAIFLNENKHLAVATNSSLIRIYDNDNMSCKFVEGHSSNILGLANHPSIDTIFASCSHDNCAKIWKFTNDGSAICLATASGHAHSVGCIALTPDFLITGSKDMCLKKWPIAKIFDTMETAVILSSSRTIKAHERDINCVTVSKKCDYIATASQDRTAKIFNAHDLEELGVLKGHKKSIWCIQFSPSDKVVATASADATIKIWTLSTFTNVSTLEGHDVAVLRIAWISNGLQLLSTAVDGLLKLWTVKDRLCVNTFDEHESHTWALTVSHKEDKLITAGSDSTIVWWKDITEEQRIKKHEEERESIEQEQILVNLITNKNWKKALKYAISLQQPFRALTTMKHLLDENSSELGSVLDLLKDEEISSLLEFVVQWNTKTRNTREAQEVLHYLLTLRYPEEIEALPDWKNILEGCLPYTERHMKRIAALAQSSAILNYFVSVTSINHIEEKKSYNEDKNLLMAIPQMKTIDSAQETDSNDEDEVMVATDSIEDTIGNYAMEKIDLHDSEDERSSDSSDVNN